MGEEGKRPGRARAIHADGQPRVAPRAMIETVSTPKELVAEALAALEAPRAKPISGSSSVPAGPGLYAIHAGGAAWRELGLGEPPDERPLYVGKAERSLASRDVATHFTSGRTGSSTLRRTLAALLRERLALRALPRRQSDPTAADTTNFTLEPAGDDRLSAWMRDRLRLATCPAPAGTDLTLIEARVLAELLPPLNLKGTRTPWREAILAPRAALAAEARDRPR
jgi:hypothetical protein